METENKNMNGPANDGDQTNGAKNDANQNRNGQNQSSGNNNNSNGGSKNDQKIGFETPAPNNPDKNVHVKQDDDNDSTAPDKGVLDPGKSDPTRIEQPGKNDPTRTK